MRAGRFYRGMVEKRSGKLPPDCGRRLWTFAPDFTAYAASKAAMARFVECLADEVLDHNVQVNSMSPGGAYTHMTDEILAAGEDRAGPPGDRRCGAAPVTGGVAPRSRFSLPCSWPPSVPTTLRAS